MHMCRVRLYFVVQEQLYNKAHSDQLLYCNPPLQDPFGGNNIDEVVLNVIHHTPQQLQEMLSHGTAKKKSSHEVPTAPIDYLQVRSTLPRNSKAMEVNIRRSSTLEVRRIKIVNLELVKASKEGFSLAHGVWNCGRTATHLKLRRGSKNQT